MKRVVSFHHRNRQKTSVSLPAYVRAWKAVKSASPDTRFSNTGFSPWSENADWLLRRFREGLEDRINRHIPNYGKGRKWCGDWQHETARAAQRLNTPRLLVRDTDVPKWLRARVAHRTHTKEDI